MGPVLGTLASDDQTDTCTLAACGPLWLCVTSYSTIWFSSRLRYPLPEIGLKCTNTSVLPSSGLMKPKPFSELNHLHGSGCHYDPSFLSPSGPGSCPSGAGVTAGGEGLLVANRDRCPRSDDSRLTVWALLTRRGGRPTERRNRGPGVRGAAVLSRGPAGDPREPSCRSTRFGAHCRRAWAAGDPTRSRRRVGARRRSSHHAATARAPRGPDRALYDRPTHRVSERVDGRAPPRWDGHGEDPSPDAPRRPAAPHAQ
jgi:hypothetical protein